MKLNVEKLAIINYPDPRLRQVAEPIEAITPLVQQVVKRMLELMVEADGVGLAAPQVGLSWRLFVSNPRGEAAKDMVFINPRLSDRSGLIDSDEGCLSIPHVNGVIRRAGEVTITATNLEGREFKLTGTELLARIWQHETDHLDGKLIIDRFSEADKLKARRSLKQLEADYKKSRPKAKAK